MAWGSASASAAPRPPSPELKAFLERLEAVQWGPLRELKTRLSEAQVLYERALNATHERAEREAEKKVESCARAASAAASQICQCLKELAPPVSEDGIEIGDSVGSGTEANLRRQCFARVSLDFQTSLNEHFQAHQDFKVKMQAKVSRQLRAAFPEADAEALAAVAAGQRSAAGAIQDSVLMQPGSGPLSMATALQATWEHCDELASLARAAEELLQAFRFAESLVQSQGDVITDIEAHLALTRRRIGAGREALVLATRARRACRCRYWACVAILVGAVAVFIAVLIWPLLH